jgi:putative OPT family oligopeptide transporter
MAKEPKAGAPAAPPGSSPAAPGGFESYIAPSTMIPELTPRALIFGTFLGVIFGASSLYLVLKVGLTVSASIPVAVISVTIFRLLSKVGMRDATILENNIAQTAGSAGESIAFGVGVTMPPILILGGDLEFTRVLLVSILGGLLGILMMIPLRRALIVQQHGILKYPEGTACAEVLKAGASAESREMASPSAKAEARAAAAAGVGANTSAKTIFAGFGIGLVYQTLMEGLKAWKGTAEKVFDAPLKSGSVGIDVSTPLLGVGYIIGPRIAAVMAAGGVLAYLVLIPLIKFFGEGLTGPLAPGTVPISEMGPGAIRGSYILYIGAGAVAAGGIISLVRSLPTIWHGLREGLKDFSGKESASTVRTDRDLPMKFVLVGILALMAAIMAFPSLGLGFLDSPLVSILGAILIIVFGFLFVTVSSRLTGEIGSSSNPISGMTVATLLLTCVIFLAMGWTGNAYYVTALSVGAIVCIAASNGGTTSQDLKTGFLVGGTPRYQQISILAGALISAAFMGPILLRLNDSATVYAPAAEIAPGLKTDPAALTETEALVGPQAKDDTNTYRVWQKPDAVGGPAGKYLVDEQGSAVYYVDPGINGTIKKRPDGSEVTKYDAPKATLMAYIIKGVLGGELPWALVLFGVMIAIVLELAGIPSLAFAVGVYLPLSASTPILVGGLVRWLVDRKRRGELAGKNLTEEQLAAESDKSPGVLMASGYIAGGAIAGILIAILNGVESIADVVDPVVAAWSKANPFHSGESADLLSLLPFAVITVVLYLVAREILLGRPKTARR